MSCSLKPPTQTIPLSNQAHLTVKMLNVHPQNGHHPSHPKLPSSSSGVARQKVNNQGGGGVAKKCSACAVHGKDVPLKGHKKFCEYKSA
jgi:hypothetical protein